MSESFHKFSKTSLQRARKLRHDLTDAERKLWSLLRDNQFGVHFRRQVPVGRYIVDFLSRKVKLIIELDGSQHYDEKGLLYDSKRDDYLRERGFVVLRFTDREFLTNSQGVLKVIHGYIQKRMDD